MQPGRRHLDRARQRRARASLLNRPDLPWVSDFTDVWTWQGWLYGAFVIDVHALRIVGLRVSKTMHADFVLDALEQVLYARQPDRDRPVHHADRGSRYLSLRCTERLAEAGSPPRRPDDSS